MAAVRKGADHVRAWPDVREHARILEHGQGGLRVEQNPTGVDAGVSAGLRKHVGKLREGDT